MKAWDSGHKAGSAIVALSDRCAGAEYSPAGSVYELNLLVERHLVDHQVGARVGVEGGIHPGLLRGLLGGLRSGGFPRLRAGGA